ncbi:MAG: hypothetical protein KGL70_11730 [Betaproteobacteria bacterium]|nr:hypothetical protein [Betaproteobacteria bacterium]
MAPENPSLLPEDAVETAIAQVLQAEAAAREAVAVARAEAEAIAEAARVRTRSIGRAADRRIAVVRSAFGAKASAEVASLNAQALALDADRAPTPDETARVERAVLSLAGSLTGAKP